VTTLRIASTYKMPRSRSLRATRTPATSKTNFSGIGIPTLPTCTKALRIKG
jgi:hypothetical protein